MAEKHIPISAKFALGGTAGMTATFFVQPLDLVKNRMQLSGEGVKIKEFKSSFHAIRSIATSDGVLSLYNGLSAGLLRQGTYTTARLGVYTFLFERATHNGKQPDFLKKIGIGAGAGAVAAFIGTPAEVALIRMTSDGRLPLLERRGYRNAFDAMYRISREEGISTLYRGCSPTVVRAIIVNAAQLGTYSQSKEMLMKTKYFNDNIYCHVCASMISGFITTVVSMPVDIAKTRVQNMRIINGQPEYRGACDAFLRVLRNEGPLALWKGFTPYYSRLGTNTVLTFIFLEQLTNFYCKYVLRTDKRLTLM